MRNSTSFQAMVDFGGAYAILGGISTNNWDDFERAIHFSEEMSPFWGLQNGCLYATKIGDGFRRENPQRYTLFKRDHEVIPVGGEILNCDIYLICWIPQEGVPRKSFFRVNRIGIMSPYAVMISVAIQGKDSRISARVTLFGYGRR